ncbi:MAG: 3-phosphoglycerate dehydrogenase family protein [Christensenellaceae bacterium]
MKDFIKLNAISPVIDTVLKDKYRLVDQSDAAEGIVVRSFDMHGYTPAESVLCVGRAGAGTNNIPSKEYAEQGIVVFNTPGANANSVKELVIGALVLSSRKIAQGIAWANSLKDGEKTVAEQVEKGKKAFAGCEFSCKTLGVYGLGAIGKKVASAAFALGMNVIGFDPYLPKDATIEGVKIVDNKQEFFSSADYITLHVPMTNETRNLICEDTLAIMKNGVKIINYSRGEIVNNDAILSAIGAGKVSCYVTDFPCAQLVNRENVICTPHLGASTEEAEDNCAVMAGKQMIDYIENGNIVNSVNYPRISVAKNGNRTVVLFKGDVADKIAALAKNATVNSAMKNEFGVCLIDTATKLGDEAVAAIKAIDGVIKVRSI